MKALYILIRQSRGTYFKILRKAFVWRAALVHKREIWLYHAHVSARKIKASKYQYELSNEAYSMLKCIDGLAQDCGNSRAIAMELPQVCTKPSICAHPQP